MQKLTLRTNSRVHFIDIGEKIADAVAETGIIDGIVTIFCPHTTAAITINENADPDVQRDMVHAINKIVPFEDGYRHFEGNSAAHLKSSLFGVSETVIIHEGRLQLGRWQGIYFCEFDGPRSREIWLKVL